MVTSYTLAELEHHFGYEIDMLNYSYELISKIEGYLQTANATKQHQEAAKYAMMETFCIHARGLIEFFTKSNGIAANFFCISYKIPKIPTASPDFNHLLNNQVTHLIYGRPENQLKIDDKKRG